MDRQPLSLWTYAAAESMFLYYFIGALALVFFITVFITKALRRKKSQVVELMENEDYEEHTVTYLVSITTSLRPGAGCPNYVKVFLQLIGDRNVSPYFTLRSDKGRRPMLNRGFTDIFLIKVKVGRVKSAKLVVSGIEGDLKWRISKVQLYNPRIERHRDLPVTVIAAEKLDDPQLKNIVIKSRSCCDSCKGIILYHQWLSRIGNTVRFGAFSDIVHVLFLFLTILTLLTLSLMLYITFPKPGVDTSTFSLNYTSFAIASSISAISGFSICLMFEVLMRKVRSRENELNYAYYSLKERKKFKTRYRQVGYPGKSQVPDRGKLQDLKGDNEAKTFVLNKSVCDAYFRNSATLNASSCLKGTDSRTPVSKVPPYIHNLCDALSANVKQGQIGLDLDRKLSLAIINSATTGLDQVVQERVITDEEGIDSETGEKAKRKKLERIMIQGNTGRGIASRTSLEKQTSLRASDSKYGVTVSDRMSNFFGSLFGGYGAVKETTESVFPNDKQVKGAEKQKQKLDKNDFVVIEKKKSHDSLMEMTFPDLEAQAWTTDMAGNLVRAKASDIQKGKRNIRAANYRTSDDVSGRYAHDLYTDDVRVEIRPENMASYNEELDKVWEQDGTARPVNKSGKAGTTRPVNKSGNAGANGVADAKRDAFVSIEMPHKKEKKNLKVTNEEKRDEKLTKQEPAIHHDLARHTFIHFRQAIHKEARDKMEESVRTWARGFVQDLLMKFRSYRDSTAEGYVTFQMTWFEVMDWVHEVMLMMTNCVVFKMKRQLFQEDSFKTQEIQNYLGHASADVILLAIDAVSDYLHNDGKNSLADLLLLSHTVMQGMRHVTDGLVYCLEMLGKAGDNKELSTLLRKIDVESDMKYVALRFLRACATWTFQQGNLSWSYIKKLIPTEDEDTSDVHDKVSSLTVLSAVGGAEKYNDIGFVSMKLTQFIIEESQEEVWWEFQDEELVFTEILVKLRMLELLQSKINALRKKKRYLDKLIHEHDKPKSRIEKRMEKRLESEKTAEERIEEEKKLEKERAKIKDPWKHEMAEKEYGDWVRESGILVRPLIVLCKIKLFLEKRWTMQGLQLGMRAEKHLAQALLQPNIAKAKDDPDGFWFENFLHFKRAESLLARYLVISADHLVKLIAHYPVLRALNHTSPVEQVVEDLVVKADIGAQVLIEDEDNILCEVMRLEIIQESQIDYDIEMKLSQQQFSSQLQHGARRSAGKPEALTRVRFDSDVNDPNTSYFVEDYYAPENEEFSSEQGYGAMYGETEGERRIRDLMVDRGLFGSLTDEEVDTLVIDINQSANTGRDKQSYSGTPVRKVTTDQVNKGKQSKEMALEEDLIQSMLSVLKPLKTYIAQMKTQEILRDRRRLQHYLEKSERKRQKACSLNYQRLLDSYYVIEENENNPSHTKESLYQLEHDFMGESGKPLPRVVKTILIWIMVLMILFSFVYVGLVAGQLSTTETQEWICYYLLSLAEFGFVLEPVRALIVGCIIK